MLSTSDKSNNQSTSVATVVASTSFPDNSSSSPISINNIKCERFSNLSPINEEISSNNINTSSNFTMDSSTKRERDCPTTSTPTPTSMICQNNNAIKAYINISTSPNNGSDHSNSSNISENLAQDCGETDINDSKNTEKNINKKNLSPSNLETVRDEICTKTSSSKIGNLPAAAKQFSYATPTSNILPSAKEETDNINSLINVKKEDNNTSPVMSPAGFGSIASLSGSNSIEVRSCTPATQDDISKLKAVNSVNKNNGSHPDSDEKITKVLACIKRTEPNICAEDSLTVSAATSLIINTSNSSLSEDSVHNNNNSSAGSITNCMEHMQQQNHIFVFSTQLANKGAESVLSGQFPTIIAYHCTQPATKSFFEDFLLKNPVKLSKFQRQNSFSLCNISANIGGQHWIGGCTALPKVAQKPNAHKVNYTNSVLQQNIRSFPEDVSENVSENDLVCWGQTGNREGHANIKLPSDVESTDGSHNIGGSSNKPPSEPDSCVANDNSTPSLQGIKVPDENLTPQQRQHREEKLAKLKQIDQFLSNPLQGGNQMAKLGTDRLPGNLTDLILNLPNSSTVTSESRMCNSVNTSVHNNPSNPLNPKNLNTCNREFENLTTLNEESIIQADKLSSSNIDDAGCRANKGGVNPSNVNIGSMTNNILPCHLGTSNNDASGRSSGASGPSGLVSHSPEMIGHFAGEGGLNCKTMSAGMQMEWSKVQYQFFEERMKNKSQTSNETGNISATRTNSKNSGNTNIKPAGSGISSASTNSQTVRSSQGPPPPYHSTQRSASVPIVTQSPNPSSPNNPTSNLSLPSPRTSGALGVSANSPTVDVHVSTMSTTLSLSTTPVSTPVLNLNSQDKNNFQSESSPTSCVINNNSRNRDNSAIQFSSNPSTPLPHLSPKDLETYHSTIPTGDLKDSLSSPQRTRTPSIAINNGNNAEAPTMDDSFSPSNPGISYTQHATNNSSITINTYKGNRPIENQNVSSIASQYFRRTDNLPLNPNSNRPSQKRLDASFDPISSLAQMSQQLTSCVSANGSGVGNVGVVGTNELSIANNGNQNMEIIPNSVDSGQENCSTSMSGNIGVPPHIRVPGPFVSSNCHINSMIGSMGQRLLNSKICSGFNSVTGGIGRDGPGSQQNAMTAHRFMGRMNFNNFNVSNSIHVKANTPNTIQYMPVRPQANDTSTMRVPTSLEFLRYANPQISGSENILDSNMGQSYTGNPLDQGKFGNCGSALGVVGNLEVGLFGSCGQLSSIVGNMEDIAGANLVSGHDSHLASHPSMIRGMRPIRNQHGGSVGSHIINEPRIQTPVNPLGPGHFSNGLQASMECAEGSLYIGNNSNSSGCLHNSGQSASGLSNQGQMYTGAHNLQKSVKTGGVRSSNSSAINNGQISANTNMISNDQNSSIPIGNNGNMIPNPVQINNNLSGGTSSTSGNGLGDLGNLGYKPFVGPTSDDVKYAEQYHSFQQQLYATSTRTQSTVHNIGSNLPANPTFFVAK